MADGRYIKRVWTPDKIEWLKARKEELDRHKLYEEFLKAFPECNCTFVAFLNERSRVGAIPYSRPRYSSKKKPLYAEQCKKSYVRIKVAQPNVWWQKQKWVYLETHPWMISEVRETDVFVFLDGNNRNFDPDNIELLHRNEQTVYIQMGGPCKEDPNIARLRIAQARMKLALLDAGERIGAVVSTSGGRRFKEEAAEHRRAYYRDRYHNDPEYRRRVLEKRAEKTRNMTPEQREKMNAYKREWLRKKKEQERCKEKN